MFFGVVRRPGAFVVPTTSIALMVVVLVSGSAYAAAEGPGWELTAQVYPTNLTMPVDAVKELKVDAEGASFILVFNWVVKRVGRPPRRRDRKPGRAASAGEQWRGGRFADGRPGQYVVRFTGILGGSELSRLSVNGAGLTGSAPSATASQRAEGATSGTIVAVLLDGEAAKGSGTVTDLLQAALRAKETGEPVLAGQVGTATNREPSGPLTRRRPISPQCRRAADGN